MNTIRLLMRRFVPALALLAAATLAFPLQADAAAPLSGDMDLLLGFHEAYAGYTHQGVDLACSCGQELIAPFGATVRFAGSVPASDDSAGCMLAVSLQMEDGRIMSFMPLAQLMVQAGDVLEEGAVLGTVASCGDRSSSAVHLHVGLRKGTRYEDPLSLIGSLYEAAAAENAASVEEAVAAALPAAATPQIDALAVGGITAAAAETELDLPSTEIELPSTEIAEGLPATQVVSQRMQSSSTQSSITLSSNRLSSSTLAATALQARVLPQNTAVSATVSTAVSTAVSAAVSTERGIRIGSLISQFGTVLRDSAVMLPSALLLMAAALGLSAYRGKTAVAQRRLGERKVLREG